MLRRSGGTLWFVRMLRCASRMLRACWGLAHVHACFVCVIFVRLSRSVRPFLILCALAAYLALSASFFLFLFALLCRGCLFGCRLFSFMTDLYVRVLFGCGCSLPFFASFLSLSLSSPFPFFFFVFFSLSLSFSSSCLSSERQPKRTLRISTQEALDLELAVCPSCHEFLPEVMFWSASGSLVPLWRFELGTWSALS